MTEAEFRTVLPPLLRQAKALGAQEVLAALTTLAPVLARLGGVPPAEIARAFADPVPEQPVGGGIGRASGGPLKPGGSHKPTEGSGLPSLPSGETTATPEGLPHMLASVTPGAWRGHPWHDHTARLVAADYLDDLHRNGEAALLRSRNADGSLRHLFIDYNDHRIHDAGEVSRGLHEGEQGWIGPGERQYMNTALWSSTGDDGNPLDDAYTHREIHPDTQAAMVADWAHFRHENERLIGNDPSNQAPHDFWLTRNGHGTGFRDRDDYYNGQSHLLEEAAKKRGEYDLHVGDDGLLHGTYEVPPTPEAPPTTFSEPATRSAGGFYASEESQPDPLAARLDGIDALTDEHAELVSDALRANCPDPAALDALLTACRTPGEGRAFADPVTPDPLPQRLAQLSSPEHARTRAGGDHPQADHALREATAADLEGRGRNYEAGVLRDRARHVMVDGTGRVVPARYTLGHLPESAHVTVSWPGTPALRPPEGTPPHAVVWSRSTPPALVHAAELPADVAARVQAETGDPASADAYRTASVEEPDPAVIHGYHFKPKWTPHGDPAAPKLGAELEVAAPPQYTPGEQERLAGRRALVLRSSAATQQLYGPNPLPAGPDRERVRQELYAARDALAGAGPDGPRRGTRLPHFGTREHLAHAARQTLDKLNAGLPPEGFAVLKKDASIEGKGFEIVTHPATLDVHKQRWPAVLGANNEAGLASNSAKYSTGLHVHVSRTGLSDLGVFKMLAFVNAAANKDYVEAVARRPSNQYAKLDPAKGPADATRRNANRYEAINLQNKHTVEFRIFGGTTDPHEFFTSLEFADAMAHFSRPGVSSSNDVIGPDAFFRFVAQNKRRYPNLDQFNRRFAAKKGLPAGFAAAPEAGGAWPPVHLSVALQFGPQEEAADAQQFAEPPAPAAPVATPAPAKRPAPLATTPTTLPLNRVDRDLRLFRQHVRSKHAMGGPGAVRPNSPEEHVLLHDFVRQRGLKVLKSPVTAYDEGLHTLFHPTPDDPHAVARAYIDSGTGVVKFAEGDDGATEVEGAAPADTMAETPPPRPRKAAVNPPATPPEPPPTDYGAQERNAFEKRIDAAPHDATNHLVYADWLDDHAEGDEAAFRRSMGHWAGEHWANRPYRDQVDLRASVWGDRLPVGVSRSDLPVHDKSLYPWNPPSIDADPTIGTPSTGSRLTNGTWECPNPEVIQYRDYRRMEEAFRRAFLAHREANPPEQFAAQTQPGLAEKLAGLPPLPPGQAEALAAALVANGADPAAVARALGGEAPDGAPGPDVEPLDGDEYG